MNSNNSDKVRSITLTLTEDCNLSCSYCYEHVKTCKKMSFETAKQILDRELSVDSEDTLYIEFFGGEPFIEFELIKEIHRYFVSKKYTKKWIMFATTNGTLVHGEIQQWLKNHKCFVCGLSLDGTKFMQDINRSNSFDSIDLDFFATTYPEQPIKMTISQETLPFLFEGIKFAHSNNFHINCNLAFGIDWSNKNNKSILESELKKIIDYYIENPQITPCSLLNFSIEHLGYEKENGSIIRKWCGTGSHMRAYDIEGESYPCQFFMPLSAGKEKAEKAKNLVLDVDIDINNIDEKCKSCLVVEACPTCYGANYVAFGNIYQKDENLCRLTKIILKARSYFKAKQWEYGQLTINKSREQALLKSIILIQEQLRIDE